MALETVARELAGERVDAVVCLGDVAQGGPEPSRTIALLRELGARVVLGNADAFLLDPRSAEGSPEGEITERQLEVRAWSLSQLSPDDLAAMEAFEATVELDLGGGVRFVGCHATPSSYHPFVLPSMPEDEFRELLAGCDAELIAGGHVHLQFLRRRGATLFLNPGSVGLSYDHEQEEATFAVDPWAAWAMVEADGGRLSVEFRRTPLDVEAVLAAMDAAGFPDAARWEPRWRRGAGLRAT